MTPENALKYNYTKIASSFTQPLINLETLLFTIYFALALSLIIFSFRVTSLKSWFIGLISFGILNIVVGICTALISSEYFYLITMCILFLVLFGYFIFVLKQKKGKGFSDVTLNIVLWMLPFFPISMYHMILQFSKYFTDYDFYSEPKERSDAFPKITFFEENGTYFLYLNVIFVILMLVYFSFNIKKWKGLAEN